MNEIVVARLPPGSIFKLLLIGMCSFQVAFSLIVLGMMLVSDGTLQTPSGEPSEYLSSYTALALYLLLGLLSTPFWAGVAWLIIWPGMWLYSKISPIKIRYVPSA